MQHYQQLDLQSLIDLLAKETELYTKALSSGKPGEIAQHKECIDALVIEITGRKNTQSMPPEAASA